IAARLGEWLKPRGAGGDVDVTTLPASGEVWVRLRAHAVTPSAAQDALALVEAKVVERLGDDYFGRDGETLERVVGRMLSQRSLIVSVAESCTGGLVGHRMTSIPGRSEEQTSELESRSDIVCSFLFVKKNVRLDRTTHN